MRSVFPMCFHRTSSHLSKVLLQFVICIIAGCGVHSKFVAISSFTGSFIQRWISIIHISKINRTAYFCPVVITFLSFLLTSFFYHSVARSFYFTFWTSLWGHVLLIFFLMTGNNRFSGYVQEHLETSITLNFIFYEILKLWPWST